MPAAAAVVSAHDGGCCRLRTLLDARLSSAGRKPRADIADPVFEEWLVDNGFVAPTELPGLRDWLAGHAWTKIDIRPSMAVEWRWPEGHPSLPAVCAAVGEFLAAIREPALP